MKEEILNRVSEELKDRIDYFVNTYLSDKSKKYVKISDDDIRELLNYIEDEDDDYIEYLVELIYNETEPFGYTVDLINLEDKYFDIWNQWAFGSGRDFEINYFIRFYFDNSRDITEVKFFNVTEEPIDISASDIIWADRIIFYIESLGLVDFLCQEIEKRLE